MNERIAMALVSDEELPDKLRDTITAFRALPNVHRLQDPGTASMRCGPASYDFADFARDRGHENVQVRMLRNAEWQKVFKNNPQREHDEYMGARHAVPYVDGHYVDWTARQYTADSPVPRVYKGLKEGDSVDERGNPFTQYFKKDRRGPESILDKMKFAPDADDWDPAYKDPDSVDCRKHKNQWTSSCFKYPEGHMPHSECGCYEDADGNELLDEDGTYKYDPPHEGNPTCPAHGGAENTRQWFVDHPEFVDGRKKKVAFVGWKLVIAADSRKKVLERRDKSLGENGDNTTPVHTFADGWSIRKLHTQGDHDYESDMMGNCVRGHASRGDMHSLRDPDNVPVLSFAMQHGFGECDSCEGHGYTNYDEECDSCDGRGRLPGTETTSHPDQPLHLYQVLRREDDEPRGHEMKKLLDGLREHYEGGECSQAKQYGGSCHHPAHDEDHGVQADQGHEMSFDEHEAAWEKAKGAEDKLPQGDVYLKIPEKNWEVDDDGLKPRNDAFRGTGPVEWSTEDPGPGLAHHVIKTPYTPRRFEHEDPFTDHIKNGNDIDTEKGPKTWVRDDAVFPKDSYKEVHKPSRPAKAYFATQPENRDNPHRYRPEGLSTAAIEGNCSLTDPRVDDSDANKRTLNPGHDIWEMNFDDEDDARNWTNVTETKDPQLYIKRKGEGPCEACGGKGSIRPPERDNPTLTGDEIRAEEQRRGLDWDNWPEHRQKVCDGCQGSGNNQKTNVIPWSKLKLVRSSDRASSTLSPMPRIEVHDACKGEGCKDCGGGVTTKIKEPEYVHFSEEIRGDGNYGSKRRHSIGEINDLSRSHLDSTKWTGVDLYGGGTANSRQLGGHRFSEGAIEIKMKNNPKYVERIPANERAENNSHALYRLKKNVCETCDGTGARWADGVDNGSDEPIGRCNDCVGGMQGVKVPRSEYSIRQVDEHYGYQDVPEGQDLAPSTMYLHIPGAHRDNHLVYGDEGIDLTNLKGTGSSSLERDYKFTDTANAPGILTGHGRHHPLSPEQADIFKIDTSKIPDWSVMGRRPEWSAGEEMKTGVNKVVVDAKPPQAKASNEWPDRKCVKCLGWGKQVTNPGEEPSECSVCDGKGKYPQDDSSVIPWDAITLHSKAEVQPVSQFKERFGNLKRLQSTAWGDVRARRVHVG